MPKKSTKKASAKPAAPRAVHTDDYEQPEYDPRIHLRVVDPRTGRIRIARRKK